MPARGVWDGIYGVAFSLVELCYLTTCVHTIKAEYTSRCNNYLILTVHCAIVFTRCMQRMNVVAVCLVFVLQPPDNTICTGKVLT